MKTIKALFVLLVSLGSVAQAQSPPQFTISTVAGSDPQSNIPGTSAKLGGGLLSVAIDSSGNLFFPVQDTVMRLSAATGQLTTVAGNGTYGFSGDGGPATSAQLAGPGGVAIDPSGNIYIADRFNNRIRKISNGVITTMVGNGTPSFGGDGGPATGAMLFYPAGVALDSVGNLYIADAYNNRVRKVFNGVITTVAGNGTSGLGGDNGPATSALLSEPNGVAVDSAGNLYICDYGTSRIRKITNGVITTVVGGGSSLGDNGPATSAQLREPGGVAIDSSGNIYIADTYNNRTRKVSNGVITTLAGTGPAGFNGDGGPATSAQLSLPTGVAIDAGGNIYIADYGNASIRKVSGGVITTVTGNGTFSGDGGPATSSQLANPFGLAVDPTGSLYIADTDNNRLRKVSNGIITTAAGTGTAGYAGPASNSLLFSYPVGVAMDSAGNIYVADADNHRVRKVSDGVITIAAGNGTMGFSGDGGSATSAELAYPSGVAIDAAGNIYIAEEGNNRVRKVSNGVITTIAGNGTFGSSGDGGPATSAELASPVSVAVDFVGNLYIADAGNSRIRKVSNGVITTIAGTGTAGFSGDNGPATNAQLNLAFGVAVDSSGAVYIADTFNHRIRAISNDNITTIAGNGTAGFAGDSGPAAKAELDSPINIAVTASGSLYIADTYNNRIRLLTPFGVSTCNYSLNPTSLQSPAIGGSLSVAIQTNAGCAWTISGLPSWVTVSGASSGSGPATITLVVAPNASTSALNATLSVAGVSLTITEAAASPTTGPSITSAGVTNAASFQTGIAPGGIITIFGTNLGATAGKTLMATGSPWPQQLGGTSVTINGATAPVYYVLNLNGQEQLSVQAPWSLAGATSASVSVTTATGTASVAVPVLAAQPGIFILDSASSGATHVNGSVVAASNPAASGEVVVLYLTGLGAVSNQPATGTSASLTTLSPTIVTPQVMIGGVSAPVAFSGLAPGFIGTYQINAIVPTGVSGLVDLTVLANGVTSNKAKIAVQ